MNNGVFFDFKERMTKPKGTNNFLWYIDFQFNYQIYYKTNSFIIKVSVNRVLSYTLSNWDDYWWAHFIF